MNLEILIALEWYGTTTVPYNHQEVYVSDNQLVQLNSINVQYVTEAYYGPDTVLYYLLAQAHFYIS
jgi:hypothetical protein